MQLAKQKPGYKQTEVGVIPADWEVHPLARVCRGISDGTHFTPKYVANGVPFYSVENITANDFDNTKFITQQEHALLIKRCKPERGDILMTRITAGILGDTKLIDWDVNASIYVSLALLKPNERISSHYLYRYTRTSFFRSDVEKRGLSNATPKKINMEAIGTIPIPVPPSRREQESIAAALSDADALIESLEKLIAKKRQIKHGTMQELLTGKRRLPGFSGKWETKRFGEIVDTDPENLGSDTRPDYAFNYISLEDVDKGTLTSYSEQVFQTAPSRARRRLRPNDVLVSTVRPNLLSHLLFTKEGGNWVCSTGFCVVRCRRGVTHPYFVFSQMFSDSVKRQIETLLTGSNYPAINSGDVRALLIPIPNYDEQSAIAAILSDMDAEIAALETKLTKARQVKQGMMQELLSGRTRLV